MNEYTIKIIIIKKSTYAVNQSLNLAAIGRSVNCFVSNPVFNDHIWKIQCKLPPKTKRFCPLVLK